MTELYMSPGYDDDHGQDEETNRPRQRRLCGYDVTCMFDCLQEHSARFDTLTISGYDVQTDAAVLNIFRHRLALCTSVKTVPY
jgi:hypothetical protein